MLDDLPEHFRKEVLDAFDKDGDGRIHPLELLRGARRYAESKTQRSRLLMMILSLVVLIVLIIGTMSAMTFMIVDMSKEARVDDDGVMRSAQNDKIHIKTAESTVAYPMNSAFSDATFHKLRQVRFQAPSGGSISLQVLGWYRELLTGTNDTAANSTVTLLTHPGHISVTGTEVVFEDNGQGVFQRLGFQSGRKLLSGTVSLEALFSALEKDETVDVEKEIETFQKYVGDIYVMLGYDSHLQYFGCRYQAGSAWVGEGIVCNFYRDAVFRLIDKCAASLENLGGTAAPAPTTNTTTPCSATPNNVTNSTNATGAGSRCVRVKCRVMV